MGKSVDKIQRLTRPIIDALSGTDDVVGVVCFGSHALGTADAHSDVDLLVLCDSAVIPKGSRRTILEGLPETRRFTHHPSETGRSDAWVADADTVVMETATVDIVYNTYLWLAAVIDQVLTEGAISIPAMPFRPCTLLGLLETGLVLYDRDGRVEGLRQRLRPYPAALKANILREYRPIMADGLAELQDYARRDIGPGAFLFHLVRVLDALSCILYAINERYDPATKRGEQALSQLRLLPADGVRRLTGIAQGPFDSRGRRRVVEDLSALIAEVERLAGG